MGFDISDLDPTNPNNWTYDAAGVIPVVGPILQSTGKKNAAENAKERREAEAEERRRFYDELGSQYEGVGDLQETKDRADTLYGMASKEIYQGELGAGRQLARAYDQRGIGNSGYASAAQNQNATRAYAERAKARQNTWDQAVGEGRSGLLGQANISHMGDPFLSQMLSSAEQQYQQALAEAAQQRDEYNQFVLSMTGYATGNPQLAKAAQESYGGAAPGGVAPYGQNYGSNPYR